ncbi:MAG: MFS transporter [Armatimonadota bacterium]
MTTGTINKPLSRSQFLVRMNWAAGFAAAFAAITMTAINRYGQALELTPFAFGVLAALPFLTAFMQIPASYLVERWGHRKGVAIAGILTHRALWLAIAAVPWIVPRAWWWLGLLAFTGLTYTFAHLGTPATTSWAADLVPARLRGRYYAVRGQLVRIINVPVCLLLGWALDRATQGGAQTLLLVLSIVLALAALLGMVDSLLCLKLPDPWHRPRTDGLPFREVLRRPLQSRNFRFFLGYNGFITLATGFVGPFVWLYLTEVVKLSNATAIFMTMVGTSFVSLFGMRLWGSLVDRWGSRRVLLFAGVLIINGASVWAFVTPGTLWWGYLLVLISSLGWPGMELAGSNLLYSMSETSRDGDSLGSAYAAINSAVVAVMGTLSGLLGGGIAELLKDWSYPVGEWRLTYHVVLFVLSGLLRIVALLWVLGLREKGR